MKNVHEHKISTVILILVFVAIRVQHLQAQDTTEPPIFLFSTSKAVDESILGQEVKASLRRIRHRSEVEHVRTVTITNLAMALAGRIDRIATVPNPTDGI